MGHNQIGNATSVTELIERTLLSGAFHCVRHPREGTDSFNI